jgi:single-strand DNA-binding protein
MNKAIMMGRLTRNPELRYSERMGEPLAIARFTLAVDRGRQVKEGEQSADFISCVAFSKLGEFVGQYLEQGTKIVLEGRIQTGSYTNQEGRKVYTTEVIAQRIDFAERKMTEVKNGFQPEHAAGETMPDGFMNIPDGVEDEGLPFA